MKNEKDSKRSSPVCYAEAKELRAEFRDEKTGKEPHRDLAADKPEG